MKFATKFQPIDESMTVAQEVQQGILLERANRL